MGPKTSFFQYISVGQIAEFPNVCDIIFHASEKKKTHC